MDLVPARPLREAAIIEKTARSRLGEADQRQRGVPGGRPNRGSAP